MSLSENESLEASQAFSGYLVEEDDNFIYLGDSEREESVHTSVTKKIITSILDQDLHEEEIMLQSLLEELPDDPSKIN